MMNRVASVVLCVAVISVCSLEDSEDERQLEGTGSQTAEGQGQGPAGQP